jgi:hypothetical protein
MHIFHINDPKYGVYGFFIDIHFYLLLANRIVVGQSEIGHHRMV